MGPFAVVELHVLVEADLASVIIGFVREKVLTPEAVEYAIDRLRQRQAELSSTTVS